MAFFKFRKNGAEQSGPAPAPESLDVLRKRARHRLIGASALVLLGVVGFPLLFDSQPRPMAVDIAIDIPDKAKAPALTEPSAPAPAPAPTPALTASDLPAVTRSASTAVASPTAATAAAVTPAASALAAKAAPAVALPSSAADAVAAPQAKASAKSEPKAEPKASSKSDAKPTAKPEDKAQSASKAQALLDGKDGAKSAPAGKRYAVQVGAFADDKKVHEVRATLEKAGLKTYTQVLNTADGKRTRVRVGPWENKAEADKAAEKIKKLNLSTSVLEL